MRRLAGFARETCLSEGDLLRLTEDMIDEKAGVVVPHKAEGKKPTRSKSHPLRNERAQFSRRSDQNVEAAPQSQTLLDSFSPIPMVSQSPKAKSNTKLNARLS